VTHGVDAKERARAALAAAFDSIAPMFQRFEDELASKELIIDSYSIADSTFTPNLARQSELGVGLPEIYPRVRAWVERLMHRSSYQAMGEFESQH
jgi:glutathione S-transferase